jgi:hypothetical protein
MPMWKIVSLGILCLCLGCNMITLSLAATVGAPTTFTAQPSGTRSVAHVRAARHRAAQLSGTHSVAQVATPLAAPAPAGAATPLTAPAPAAAATPLAAQPSVAHVAAARHRTAQPSGTRSVAHVAAARHRAARPNTSPIAYTGTVTALATQPSGIRSVAHVSAWDALDWDELYDPEKAAFETLGWSRDNWNSVNGAASSSKDWSELTRKERNAAQALGYNEQNWDVDCPNDIPD